MGHFFQAPCIYEVTIMSSFLFQICHAYHSFFHVYNKSHKRHLRSHLVPGCKVFGCHMRVLYGVFGY
jgi:hypothetical protein